MKNNVVAFVNQKGVDDVRVLAAEVGLAVEPGWFPPRHVLLVWESARADQRQMTLGI